MNAPLGNRLMQLFFRLRPHQQDLLVQIAEALSRSPGGSEQDGDAMETLRLVVGNKKGGE